MKVTLKILSRDTSDNDANYSVGYVNPAVSNTILKTFAQTVSGMTTNTFRGVLKITEEDITSAGD